jgi:hypothetical protein
METESIAYRGYEIEVFAPDSSKWTANLSSNSSRLIIKLQYPNMVFNGSTRDDVIIKAKNYVDDVMGQA